MSELIDPSDQPIVEMCTISLGFYYLDWWDDDGSQINRYHFYEIVIPSYMRTCVMEDIEVKEDWSERRRKK